MARHRSTMPSVVCEHVCHTEFVGRTIEEARALHVREHMGRRARDAARARNQAENDRILAARYGLTESVAA